MTHGTPPRAAAAAPITARWPARMVRDLAAKASSVSPAQAPVDG